MDLLITIAIFTFIQTVLGLFKDETKKHRTIIIRILTGISAFLFIVTIGVIINGDKESKTNSNLIKNTNTAVNSIDTATNELQTRFRKSHKYTLKLLNTSDSMNQNLLHLNKTNKDLINQYKTVNSQLSKQVDFELKKFKEDAPIVNFLDDDISWNGSDSTKQQLNIKIKNLGKRNATILSTKGYINFFNKENQSIFCADFQENNRTSILIGGTNNPTYCEIFAFKFKDFQELKSLTNYAYICMKIRYRDIAYEKDTTIFRFSGWVPEVGFGTIKEWQVNVAKKWAIENGKN